MSKTLLLFAVLHLAAHSPQLMIGADFPQPRNTEPDLSIPLMSAEEAASRMQVPDGFKVNVFAAEPDVQNPIGMAWDQRGRLWIAENYTYAERSQQFDLSLRDRVLVLEDSNGDGRADSRKVFTDDVQMLSSVETGRGGAWLMCPPQLLFLPDANNDDVPDGTTNPWGHDWDRHGELVFNNTVNGHLWHVMPSAHFKESFGASRNPNVHEQLDTIADHWHFDTNGRWQDSRGGKGPRHLRRIVVNAHF